MLVKKRINLDRGEKSFLNLNFSEKMAAQLFNRLGQLGLGVAIAGGVVNSALFNVDGGYRAVMFDK